MQELIQKIEQWAHDRNIINGSKPIDQAMKLFSEFGELADNVGKGRDCRDDVGDVFVVLTIMAKQTEIGLWETIKEDYSNHDVVHGMFSQIAYEAEPVKNRVIELGESLVGLFQYGFELSGEYDELFLESVVILNSIAHNKGYTLEECVQIAYNDIKDRKGVMYNGVFVKESDPSYQDILDKIKDL